MDKHFDAKRAEEFEKTGQEWTSLGERDLLFQRAGVAVARGNSLVLDSLSHAWSSARSKQHQSLENSKVQKFDTDASDGSVSQLEGEAIVRATRGCGF